MHDRHRGERTREDDPSGPSAEEVAAATRARDAWMTLSASTQPCDRAAAEYAVYRLYRAYGLARPMIVVWVESPLGAAAAVATVDGSRPAQLYNRRLDQLWPRVLARVDEQLPPGYRALRADNPFSSDFLFDRVRDDLATRLGPGAEMAAQHRLDVHRAMNRSSSEDSSAASALSNMSPTVSQIPIEQMENAGYQLVRPRRMPASQVFGKLHVDIGLDAVRRHRIVVPAPHRLRCRPGEPDAYLSDRIPGLGDPLVGDRCVLTPWCDARDAQYLTEVLVDLREPPDECLQGIVDVLSTAGSAVLMRDIVVLVDRPTCLTLNNDDQLDDLGDAPALQWADGYTLSAMLGMTQQPRESTDRVYLGGFGSGVAWLYAKDPVAQTLRDLIAIPATDEFRPQEPMSESAQREVASWLMLADALSDSVPCRTCGTTPVIPTPTIDRTNHGIPVLQVSCDRCRRPLDALPYRAFEREVLTGLPDEWALTASTIKTWFTNTPSR